MDKSNKRDHCLRQLNKLSHKISKPSSSSSSISHKWTHDVFPSFRGEDVRRNFLSHIQKEFRRKGIIPFIDNDIKRGESIGPELIQAIRRSKIAVVLLSRNYASSKWCLDELTEIMKCKKELGQMVFAIFYEVDPSDVKKLTGDFGAVFHKTCAGKTKEDILRWRQAFAEVATIAGYDSRNWDNEAVMIEEIVTQISKRFISSTPSRYMEGLIGMGAHMEKMKLLLCLGSDEVRRVGIWGPPGIGKTTIARVIYDQISSGFQLSAFMTFKPSYARPTCSCDHDEKLHLEQQFLSKLLDQEDIKIHHLGATQNFLMHKKVLVIFDGVERLVQLDVMPKAQRLGHGSRIIITTQNQKILKAFEIKHIYQVDFPPDNEALQIFCMSAFGQKFPKDGFRKLAEQVTRIVGGLPLGLKVMGSHFRGILSKQEWIAELPRLKVRLDGEIGSILKFSYDALEEEDKDLFLYIACFFVNEALADEIFEDVLRYRFSNVSQGLNVLIQRSLLSYYRQMHSLLVKLGREIVRNKSIDEPGKRQFLVDAKDICEVLTDNTGSRSVIGINLNNYEMEDDIHISDRAFEEMSNLQLLIFSGNYFSRKRLHLPQGLKYLPPKLRILHWNHYPLTCLPCNFNPKFLVTIEMTYSKLETLWEGIQPLKNLKRMDLNNSRNLKALPNLSNATNLKMMNLAFSSSLVELPSSIGNLTNLRELNLMGCSSLLKLPSSIGNLTNLRELPLRGCSGLLKLPSSIGNLTNLRELNLCCCSSLLKLPSSIGNLTNFGALRLSECSSLMELPSSVGNLTSLERLELDDCSSLVKLPSSFVNLTNLQVLNPRGCAKLEVLPTNLGSLVELDVTGCSQLTSIPEVSTEIKRLKLRGTLIKEVPLWIKSCSELEDFSITYSKQLEENPHLLDIITELELNDKDMEQIPPWVNRISRLQLLVINKCTKLVSLTRLPGSLSSLDVQHCDSLERLAFPFPNPCISVRFINCWKLNEEARDIIIRASSNSTAVLPGREVPAFFTHRATAGGSVKANLAGTSLRFQACISLVRKADKGAGDEKYVEAFCSIVDKQSGLDISSLMSGYYIDRLLTEHLYIFQVEADSVQPGEHFFEFILDTDKWEVAECGVRQLLENED